MTLSLDTNVFVEVIRGSRPIVRQRFREANNTGKPLAASLIVLHELYFGAELHPNRDLQRANVHKALSTVDVCPLDEADIDASAAVRARLRRLGSPIGPYDLLIAGQALARGWTVVTANTREFARIEGLNVIDWTAPAD